MGVLLRELTALYAAFSQGQPSPLPPLSIQYADFAVWQRQYLQGERFERQLNYWKTQLAGAPDLLQLPTDRPRPPQQSFRGDMVTLTIDADLTQRLRSLSQAHDTTLYMTLLAAFQILMGRYSGQSDLVVGSPIANRNYAQLEPLIGFFVNTLALRADLGAIDGHPPSFLDVLAQMQALTRTAYDHQDLPFERLVEELQPARNLNYNPLVQVMFALQNAPMGELELAGLRVTQGAGRRAHHALRPRNPLLGGWRPVAGQLDLQHRSLRQTDHRAHGRPFPDPAAGDCGQPSAVHRRVAAAHRSRAPPIARRMERHGCRLPARQMHSPTLRGTGRRARPMPWPLSSRTSS